MFNRMNPQDDENNKCNNLMNKNNNKNMNMKISSSSSSLASFEDDTKNTQEQLNTLQKLIQAKHTLTKSPNRAKNYKQLAIILGGIGSQWEFMGTKLIYFSNSFRNTISRLTRIIKEVDTNFEDLTTLFSIGTKWSLKKYMGVGIVAYQIGVINILKEAGIKPDYIVGHSIGETSAGYLAGLTTEKETILIQYFQSEMVEMIKPNFHVLITKSKKLAVEMQANNEDELVLNDNTDNFYYYVHKDNVNKYIKQQNGDDNNSSTKIYDLTGKMSYCGLSKKEIEAAIDELNLKEVIVGCENSPHGQTISGSAKQVDILHQHFISTFQDRNDGTKLFWRDLDTDQIAYHSPLFSIFQDWLIQRFRTILKGNNQQKKNNKIIQYGWLSSSSDKTNNDEIVFDEYYHAQTIVSSVKFQRCIETLSMMPSTTLLMEIGSSSSLLGQVKRIDNQIGTLGFVKHGEKEDESKYLDTNELRILIFKNGYSRIFCNSIKHVLINNYPNKTMAKHDHDDDENAGLIPSIKQLNEVLNDIEFLKKEEKLNVQNLQKALSSIVKARKPREKMVTHILKRVWIRCICDPHMNIPMLYPLLREFTKKKNEFYDENNALIIHAKNILRLLRTI